MTVGSGPRYHSSPVTSRPLRPQPTLIYRIVHVDNLVTLARRGRLHAPATVPADGLPYRPIHDESIRLRRGERPVSCGPGGTVNEYLSFYLGPRSPMLYRISRGTVRCEGGERSVVYLVSSVEKLRELHLPFVFSDGHGLPAITRWYDDPADLDRLDWEAILSRFWFDTDEDPDRCRRKQAELLVYRSLPWSALLGIGVIDEAMRQEAESRLTREVEDPPYLRVRKDWYYGP
jgi:ssDNA thymidine ADP-ribosyltransferase DarT-like protein